MKSIIKNLLPIFMLTSCSTNNVPKIGDKVMVHEYYSAMVNSYVVEDSAHCISKEESEVIYEKNGFKYVLLNITIYGNQNSDIYHKLDGDDFKLCDGQSVSASRRKPLEDYEWIGKEIITNSKVTIKVSFEVPAGSTSSYQYLEIDFKASIGNASYIHLVENK